MGRNKEHNEQQVTHKIHLKFGIEICFLHEYILIICRKTSIKNFFWSMANILFEPAQNEDALF